MKDKCESSENKKSELSNGYQESAPNTQTKTTRGTGAATKGTMHSKNSQ
jgi:hypothetical protein